MYGHLKLEYEVPNRTAPNRIALTQTWSQTKSCITKSCEICALLIYYSAQIGNSTPTLRDNLLVPYSRVKKSKERIQYNRS